MTLNTRDAIENAIKEEMRVLYTSIEEIKLFKKENTPLSDNTKKFLQVALFLPSGRIELAKALRLRIRLFGSTRVESVPNWLLDFPNIELDSLEKRIGERLRADLPKKIGFLSNKSTTSP